MSIFDRDVLFWEQSSQCLKTNVKSLIVYLIMRLLMVILPTLRNFLCMTYVSRKIHNEKLLLPKSWLVLWCIVVLPLGMYLKENKLVNHEMKKSGIFDPLLCFSCQHYKSATKTKAKTERFPDNNYNQLKNFWASTFCASVWVWWSSLKWQSGRLSFILLSKVCYFLFC